jgi:hypothetical protein
LVFHFTTKQGEGANTTLGRAIRIFAIIFSFLAFSWSVCGIELMLINNHITKAYSLDATGQLIPLSIGVSTVAKLVYNAIMDDFKPPKLIWAFLVSCELFGHFGNRKLAIRIGRICEMDELAFCLPEEKWMSIYARLFFLAILPPYLATWDPPSRIPQPPLEGMH